MTPLIRILREDWADVEIALPSYETKGAAGADLRANLLSYMASKYEAQAYAGH